MDERTIGKLTFQAIHELKIDVPVMKIEVAGDQIELSLYGGRVVVYPPEEKIELPRSPGSERFKNQKETHCNPALSLTPGPSPKGGGEKEG